MTAYIRVVALSSYQSFEARTASVFRDGMKVVCSSEMVVPIQEDDVRIPWTALLVSLQNIT